MQRGATVFYVWVSVVISAQMYRGDFILEAQFACLGLPTELLVNRLRWPRRVCGLPGGGYTP